MICIGGRPPAAAAPARIPHLRCAERKARKPNSRKERRWAAAMDAAMKPGVATRPLFLTSGASGRVSALLSVRALRSLLLLLNGFILLLLLPFRRRTVVVTASSERSSPPSSDTAGEEKGEGKGASSGTRAVVVRVPAAMVPRRPRAELEAAARRGMAIRRLGPEEEREVGEGSRRSVREFALLVTTRGDTLFTQSWTPASLRTRGLVVLLHGLNEHSGRYNYFAKQLNDNGFKVYAMDWIGHGGSDWLHGYVHSIDYAVTDLKSFLEKVLAQNPGLPCFCFGHSTGAAIILKAVLDPKIEFHVDGLILTSPAIGVQPSHPIIATIAPIFSLLVPKYQFSAAYNNGPPVSRDPEALRAKYSDPLVFTGSIRFRTGNEILRISAYLQQNLNRVTVPFLVLHGTADTLTDPEASQRLYDEASSADKTIKLYEGFLHDLLFEPERDDISRDIIDWLSSRTDALIKP